MTNFCILFTHFAPKSDMIRSIEVKPLILLHNVFHFDYIMVEPGLSLQDDEWVYLCNP